MFHTLKHRVFIIVFSLLWIRLLLMFADPSLGPGSDGWGFYAQQRQIISLCYTLSGFLVWPFDALYQILKPSLPSVSWFPSQPSAGILAWYRYWANVSTAEHLIRYGQLPWVVNTFTGRLDTLTLFAMLGYTALNPALDRLYDEVRVWYWKALVKVPLGKGARDLKAYEEKAAGLMQQNASYRGITPANNLITASVVTDELTRIYNKQFFMQKLGQVFHGAKNEGVPLSVALMELDGYHDIVNRHGFAGVEKVLQAMASVAKDKTPEGCFVCRTETQQFGLILPGKSLHEARDITAEIHQYFDMLRYPETPDLRSTASIGLVTADFSAASPPPWQSFNQMLKFAEDELRLARNNGRNRIEARAFPEPGA